MAAPSPARRGRPGPADLPEIAVSCAILAATSLAVYELTTTALARFGPGTAADRALGGLWAVVAAIFVYRSSYEQSVASGLSRMAATFVSFVLCLAWLSFLPPSPWGMAVLIGVGAAVVIVAGRPGDAVTTGITTVVVMVAASLSPRDAWEQPILRLADTAIGVAAGVAAAWVALRIARRLRVPPAG
jgi:uncharacterized membrane protein YccC